MLLSLQLPCIFPISRLLPHCDVPLNLGSSTAGKKRSGNNLERLSSASASASPVRKVRLESFSVSVSVSENGNNNIDLQLETSAMPKHVAIIIDGHAKWSRSRGVPTQHGHKLGLRRIKHVASHASKLRINLLTIYVFSTENWKRPKMEVDFLMKTFEDVIRYDVKELITRDEIRFSVIGDKSRLPESLQNTISWAEEYSEDNKGLHFIMALSYGGRYDIVEATKKIATKVEHGSLRAIDIDRTMFEQHLLTSIGEYPNPDLLIKMGGEVRLSDFYLWQLAYTELYFTDRLFPDFGEADLLNALAYYQTRSRSFGKRIQSNGK